MVKFVRGEWINKSFFQETEYPNNAIGRSLRGFKNLFWVETETKGFADPVACFLEPVFWSL